MSEITKLAAKLKQMCPYCGRRHAGKHNEKQASFCDENACSCAQRSSLSQRSQYPTQPARRDTTAMTPPAKTAMESLRDKLAQRMSPVQQHALSDAWRAHAQAPVSTQMPMRMNPQDALARQQMLQNPQMFTGGGGAPSGLELARPSRPAMPMMKRSSEIEKLREKIALLPALAAAAPAALSALGGLAARTGLMAGGRALLGAGARAMATPVGRMVGEQALGAGVQMGAQKLTQPRQQPLPGQIGGV